MRKNLILGGILTALSAALPQSGVAAPYSGEWRQTGIDPVGGAELTFFSSGPGLFYLYDIDAVGTPNDLLLLVDGQMFSASSPSWFISFETWDDNPDPGFADWKARATALHTDGSQTHLGTIGLGHSELFGFYFSDGQEVFQEYDLLGPLAGGSYVLNSLETGMTVSIENGAPVPVPASFLLFGSGLLGLAGISRRRARKG